MKPWSRKYKETKTHEKMIDERSNWHLPDVPCSIDLPKAKQKKYYATK